MIMIMSRYLATFYYLCVFIAASLVISNYDPKVQMDPSYSKSRPPHYFMCPKELYFQYYLVNNFMKQN